MIKGGRFYAFYNEYTNTWSKNIEEVAYVIDAALNDEAKGNPYCNIEYISSYSSKKWTEFLNFVRSLPDKYVELDRNVLFNNSEIKKDDYSTHHLAYNLSEGDMTNYETLVSTLYSPEERQKFEWAIGAIATGDAKWIQKFIVFRGNPGSGKSTIINIIQMLFDGYYNMFDAKSLGNPNNTFALEPFATNPLVAIQHDGDLSGIEDNTRLNSIIAHERMNINEKFKNIYSAKFDSFLIMGTNKPVKITDSKSGIIRRLIDIYPSDNKLPVKQYTNCMKKIQYELGAIMTHCIAVYEELGSDYYDAYVATEMVSATNDMWNFVEDHADVFLEKDATCLNEAWKLYSEWAEEANVKYPYTKRFFKDELKSYFKEFAERGRIDGVIVRNVYSGFKKEKFFYFGDEDNGEEYGVKTVEESIDQSLPDWLKLTPHTGCTLDIIAADCKAQLAVERNGVSVPQVKWVDCTTKMSEIDPTQEHYLKVQEYIIVVDFDIQDALGNKDLNANLKAAAEWPKTYAETSKSGKGIHLHYIYEGDVSQLSRLYAPNIEIKVFTGGAALRRKLYLANDLNIARYTGVLPKKEAKKMVNWDGVKNERMLRAMIAKNLNKEYHDYTKPSIDYIKELMDQAYDSGIHYDVSDMRPAIRTFAINSSHQSSYCLTLMQEMKWKSEEDSPFLEFEKDEIVFYDVEVFPNLFVVCCKRRGHPTQAFINPSSAIIEQLCKYKLIGFNNRDYDNHILYARMMGYTELMLYQLSKRIIGGDNTAKFANAYNISYTDIYDFCKKKQSLKKWEIELGILHLELGLDWDTPVPEDLWGKVVEYCKNDVDSTEAVFDANIGDFMARQILADMANILTGTTKSTENTKTNTLTERIIFGNAKNYKEEFNCPDLSIEFPGYKFDPVTKTSTYRGRETGEGGYVWSDPGIFYNVWTFDVAGMHPSSAFAMNLFGDRFTKQYKLIYDLRILIKHKELEKAKELFDHKLDKYLDDPKMCKALSGALKIAINSVYGLTSAAFDNAFKDPRNIDNVVAKRGALFMINLLDEVMARGGQVIHIKTDSIKVVNPSKKIADFIFEYGKKYGYTFEVEHVFDRICLVNNAVYVGKLGDKDPDEEARGEWTATGTQFKVPYVFKTLFSGEELTIHDFLETKESKAGAIYMDFSYGREDVTEWEKFRENRRKKREDKKITKKAEALLEEYSGMSDKELDAKIAAGHDYRFVGRVGCFCPVKQQYGALLMAKNTRTQKYSAVTGSSGHYWLEASDVVYRDDCWDILDKSYHEELAMKAKEAIDQFGSYDIFVSENGLPFE